MKKINKYGNKLLFLPCLFFLLITFHSTAQPGGNTGMISRMEQRAIITATVFQDKNILNAFVKAIKLKLQTNDMNDEAITFDEIASGNAAWVSGFAPLFKVNYMQVFNSGSYYNAAKYSGLSTGSPSGKIDNSFNTMGNQPFFYNDGAQIYFPYSENFSEAQVTSVYVTFNPLEDLETNTGYLVNNTGQVQTLSLDENYAMSTPALVINFDESEGTPAANSPNQPNGVTSCDFLKDNVIADLYDDRYVITVTMPKIKLLRNFRTWLGGSNYLTIYAFYAKPNLLPGIDALDSIPITPNSRLVFKNMPIKRRYVNKWYTIGQIFNDDWRLVQYDNPFYSWYRTGWFINPKGSVDVSVAGGVKCIDSTAGRCKRWKPSFDAGFKAGIHFDIESHQQIIGSDYPSRRGTMANALGNNFGNGTALEAGENQPWALRRMSNAFLFYYKVRVCQ